MISDQRVDIFSKEVEMLYYLVHLDILSVLTYNIKLFYIARLIT